MDVENLISENDDNIYEQVFQFFSKGGTFKDLKNMSEEAMEAIYSVAYSLYESAKYDESLKIFQFLCFYDHFNKKYFMGLGACQQMLKNYDSAMEIFSFVTVLDSEDPRSMVYLGDCYLALGKNKKAEESYKTAIIWSADNPEYDQERQRATNMLENI
ncbi:MAG: SycD/LcrH family type III secretion system chaperone [Endozoicomonas sp. (ex Botrylloides leachii)]|nr:SycD/LcrH family type III secretion system chaperone [Endozoicomonas sp. (ex Botrylloides leachii)]